MPPLSPETTEQSLSSLGAKLLAEGGSGYHFFGQSVERVTLCRAGGNRAQDGGAESGVA